MTITSTDQLTDTFTALREAAETALANQCPDEFSGFEKYVNEVEVFVRETQQAMWADEAKQAIKRLEKGSPLTEADKDVIRTFLVSDAEHYLAVENNYGDWINELKRLVNDLQLRSRTADRHTIGEMRGVLKDAIRLVPDIRNYLEEQQRVEKFTTALQSLDQPSRDMLANLLRDQLKSEKR